MGEASRAMPNKRLLELDALRGIAVLAVVLYHYFYHYDEIYGHENIPVSWSYFGKLGVGLFFMVSGFVIFWTLNRTEKPLDFIVSRFSRLYPAYWAALVLTFSVVFVFGLPGREVSLGDAALNTLMFHEYLHVPHVDGVYWTLTVELTFYFWMFALYMTDKLNSVERICIPLILISIAHSAGLLAIPDTIYQLLIIKYIPLFAAGISFYQISHNHSDKATIAVLILSLFSTIVIYSFDYFMVFFAFYLTFFLAVSGHLKCLANSPFVVVGGISYSLYLVHQHIGYVVINEFYKYEWHPLLGILVSILLSMILALLLSKYIEKPSMTFIRQHYKHNNIIQRVAKKLARDSSH
jgi:peptidoglycan/LPS O-acetylase OafA/YrhL